MRPKPLVLKNVVDAALSRPYCRNSGLHVRPQRGAQQQAEQRRRHAGQRRAEEERRRRPKAGPAAHALPQHPGDEAGRQGGQADDGVVQPKGRAAPLAAGSKRRRRPTVAVATYHGVRLRSRRPQRPRCPTCHSLALPADRLQRPRSPLFRAAVGRSGGYRSPAAAAIRGGCGCG